MSTTPPPRQRPLPPPSRRRDKPQLSCNLCRRRKVKCDRQQPCKTCTFRGLAASCSYPPDGSSRSSDRDPYTVQNRIHELENLVHALMKNASKNNSQGSSTTQSNPPLTGSPIHRASDSSPEPPEPGAPGASGPGELLDGGTLINSPAGVPSYVDGAHWTALLDSISELKDYLQDAPEPNMQFSLPPQIVPDYGSFPLLLYGGFAQTTKGEILSAIPPRPIADRLVSQFFNTVDLAPGLIHSPQFIRQYDQFWSDPSGTPISWIGLLFSMMCVSTLLSMQHAGHDPSKVPQDPENGLRMRVYREKTVQCLTMAKYTMGGVNIIPAFILYIAIEHLSKADSEFGTHILLGLILNIALRMGYHRDPKNFPVLTPFEGEMRRRTWSTLYQANLIFAAQMGIPTMIQEYHTDIEEPHNVFDSDFDENSTEIPPSRPETEMTPVLYIITRDRVAHIWEKIRDAATDTRHHKYQEILAMDGLLQAEKSRLPPPFKVQPIAQSIAVPPNLIVQRIWLDICYLRLQIVLHQKYFMAPAHHERYSHSRSVSLKGAVKIVEYQDLMFELVKPDNLLYEARWKLTSIMNNEFLLATSILCAYVKQVSDIPQSAVEGTSLEEVTELLKMSATHWERQSTTSKNARKALKAIYMVLQITGTSSTVPVSMELDLSSMLAFRDPLLLDFNFPGMMDGFYSGDDSASGGDLSLESSPYAQPQLGEDWINMFQRISTTPRMSN